jgi:hypothetical protein
MKMKTATLLVFVCGSVLAGCVGDDDLQSDDIEGAVIGTSPPATLGSDAPYCVTEASAAPIGAPAPAVDKAAVPRCFKSFAEAVSVATAGRVQLAASDTPTTPGVLDRLDTGPGASASPYVVAIEYVAPNWDSYWGWLLVTSSVSCYGYNLSLSAMPAGWDNVVSSARSFSGCNRSYHYDGTYFTGGGVDCGSEGCYYDWQMGWMNDRTSSIYWTN